MGEREWGRWVDGYRGAWDGIEVCQKNFFKKIILKFLEPMEKYYVVLIVRKKSDIKM